MPRTRRLIPVDAAVHVICRGNNKQIIFNTLKDKRYYRFLLGKFKKENNIKIFHYCIMNSHVHLIVWLDSTAKLSRFIKQANLSYYAYYNRNYGYEGHLWRDRFRTNIIDTDSYLLQCGKYIELNPVRAGIAESPAHYEFSSYNYYAKGKTDALITCNPLYLALSDNESERRRLYVEFVIDSSIICRESLIKRLFIGSEKFVTKMNGLYLISAPRSKRGRPRKIEPSPIL